MINVSNAFRRELFNDRKNYLEYADITLKGGKVLNLLNEDLWSGGMTVEDAVSKDSSFDVGSAIINKCTLVINNIYDKFSRYDFGSAKIVAYVGLRLPDGTVEKVRKGTYTVDEARYDGSIITLSCLDNMSKFDKPYSQSTLKYPATLGVIVRDACTICGVPIQTYNFPHDSFVVQERPEDKSTTFREVISWCAQIACCFCRCDVHGRLELKWYDQRALEGEVLNGGFFDNFNQSVYESGDTADGGTFIPWNEGAVADGGVFGDRNGVHVINSFYSMNVSVDDVVITGVRVLEKSKEEGKDSIITYQVGKDGYVVSIENNELIKGGAGETVAGWVGEQLIGLRFRKADISHASDPTMEAGDVGFLIDRKQNVYPIPISSTRFSTGGNQSTKSGAQNPARNSAARYSAETKNYVDYRKDIEKERSDREIELERLKDRIDNSPGLFTTTVTQDNGSSIFYLHDKPTLSESRIVWKMTAEAWAVSTDGGETYNAGITVDGDVIARILTATGVNADWVKTGALRVQKGGKTMVNMDFDTGRVDMVVDSFSLTSGKTIEDIAREKAMAEVKSFVSAVYDPQIASLQSQVDGQIETWYYDYEPTLSNYPASSWATETERVRHEGDLFYWKSKGYSYRFFRDGSAWKWQLITDSDITKALRDASKAQDTADGKRRVFVATPMPPYDVGDLWVQGSAGDIMRCQVARQSGSYVSTDWIKASKYTDDSALTAFIQGDFNTLKSQADKKAETWYQSSDPSTAWTTSTLKSEHVGDIWFNSSSSVQKSYRWNGSSWVEMKTTPPPEIFDKIDGKAQVFVATPVPPYDVGDLWFNGTTSDIMTCVTKRTSGSFYSSDWQKRNKYVDQTAVDTAANTAAKNAINNQTQTDIFNKLTNNGKMKGIYMEGGELYINATYLKSGDISADRIHGGILALGGLNDVNGKLSVRNSSGTEIGRWDNAGIYVNAGSMYCKTATTGASMYGGRIHLTYGSTDVGYIGTNYMNGYSSHKGLDFDLEDTGSYMCWAAKSTASDAYYNVKLIYANKSFASYTAGKLYAMCDMDFKNYEIQNAYINGLKVRGSLNVPNNVACDIHSDVDFHLFSLKNVKINNLDSINGYAPFTGTIPIITKIQALSGGGIQWWSSTITVKDGIITSAPTS